MIKKISEFETVESLEIGDILPIVRGSNNFKIDAVDVINYIPYVNINGPTYTIQLSDIGYYIRKSYTSSHLIYLPTSIYFPSNVLLSIRNVGTGTLTLTSSNIGVTLNYDNVGLANVVVPNTSIQVYHVGSGVWDLV
jgi:hypothetical protein